jgi:hypothetical protein
MRDTPIAGGLACRPALRITQGDRAVFPTIATPGW